MQKIIHVKCPKCNNNQHFHKFGKDKFGNQKYRCLDCGYQFAPDFQPKTRMRKYPPCPVCGKSSFLHHDYRDYSNYRCCDKKCITILRYFVANAILFSITQGYMNTGTAKC